MTSIVVLSYSGKFLVYGDLNTERTGHRERKRISVACALCLETVGIYSNRFVMGRRTVLILVVVVVSLFSSSRLTSASPLTSPTPI